MPHPVHRAVRRRTHDSARMQQDRRRSGLQLGCTATLASATLPVAWGEREEGAARGRHGRPGARPSHARAVHHAGIKGASAPYLLSTPPGSSAPARPSLYGIDSRDELRRAGEPTRRASNRRVGTHGPRCVRVAKRPLENIGTFRMGSISTRADGKSLATAGGSET